MRLAACLASIALLFISAAGLAQSEPSPLYSNQEYKFAVIFPSPPMSRDVSFMAKDGSSRAAKQFYLDQGQNRYSVTLVKFADAPAVDSGIVAAAADQLRKKGTVRFEFHNCYDPGVPGHQLNMAEANGRQLRASIYMWDHQLYITEASAEPGSQPALQFEQSITILDSKGEPLDNGQGSPPC
jgi:hypothetical protein